MLYLTTGANGAGKTLLTLKAVREMQLKETRPVYHNGRFKLTADFGWQQIDFKDWQACPDGSIFLIDEAHNDMPVRKGGEPPEAIKMLAEHRRRGMDFFLISQHPLNIDAFVRRLIGSPGWHRHLKRASGAPLVSVLEWPSVNTTCEKAGAGESGSVTMVPYPTEVYKWYESTSLDTAKVKIPFQAKVLIAALLAVPVLVYFGYTKFQAGLSKPATAASAPSTPGQPGISPMPMRPASSPMSAMEYVATFKPRLDSWPHSAPRYDKLTEPTAAPYPAACIMMGSRCECFTQQATTMPVDVHLCLQIVKSGYFMDWTPPEIVEAKKAARRGPENQRQGTQQIPKPGEAPKPMQGGSAPAYAGPVAYAGMNAPMGQGGSYFAPAQVNGGNLQEYRFSPVDPASSSWAETDADVQKYLRRR